MEQTRWEDEEVCGTSAIAPPPAPSHVAPPASQQQQPSPAAHHCDVPVAATAASSASVAQHHHHHHHSARRLASSASRQSSSTRIVLYILSTMATAFRLKARETDSVAKLKARIAHATGIPVWSQALVVRDTELADNSGMTLRQLGLRTGGAVTLVVRAQSGPFKFAAMPQMMACTLTVEQIEHLLQQSSSGTDAQLLHDVQHSPDLVPALAQIGDRQVLVMFHPRTGTIAGLPRPHTPTPDHAPASSTTTTTPASAADREAENTKMRDAMASVRARLAQAKSHSNSKMMERSEMVFSSSAASSAVDLPTALHTTTTSSSNLYEHLLPLNDASHHHAQDDDDDDDLRLHLGNSMHDDTEDELDTARHLALSVRRPSTPEPVVTSKTHSSKPRCMCCQKKMSTLEAMMPCRCSGAYCREHRIAHACPYDYKSM